MIRQDELEDAEAEIKRLKAVLKPFTQAALVDQDAPDNTCLSLCAAKHLLTIGNVRKAAKASK